VSAGEWHRVADAADVEPDEPKKVQVGEEEIALFNVDGTIHATANICTHAYASLADGFQEGEEIECPLHEGRFNVKTGKALCPPVSEDLRTFEVKVENGGIFVKI
jgi:naphthalene 1,2-dioxygenase system ferredoxin subunit